MTTMTSDNNSKEYALNDLHETLIASSEEGLTVVEVIDPARAERYLARNTANRARKRAQIEAWSRAMAEGRWQLTGESIKFSKKGRLLDGQNRLLAIVKSGATVRMLVTYGLEEQTQEVMDSGSRRSVADALEIDGERYARSLQAAAIMVFTEGGANRRAASHDELIELVRKDPSIRDIVCNALPGLQLSSLLPPAVQFYAYWTLAKLDPAKCAAFFHSLSTLEGLSAKSPILALHRRLTRLNNSRRGKGSHAYRQEALACIFSAWNAWVKGEERVKIQVNYGDFGKLSVPTPVAPPGSVDVG